MLYKYISNLLVPHEVKNQLIHDTPSRHSIQTRADLELCNPVMWNVTQEYTTTHFNVLYQTLSGNPNQSPTALTFFKLRYSNIISIMKIGVYSCWGKIC